MWEHYLIDNPPPKSRAITDSDYDAEEAKTEGYDAEQAKEEGRLPIADHEHFEDPEFDAEWDAPDTESDSDTIGEKPSEDDFQSIGEETEDDTESDIDLDNPEQWEVL